MTKTSLPLELFDQAVPALRAVSAIVRALAGASTRESLSKAEMDALLDLAAQQVRIVLDLIEKVFEPLIIQILNV